MHRATANLLFNNCVRSAQDAARALEMFVPAVAANLSERVKCHIIRGRSLRELKMFTEALMDFVEASKLDPKNENLKSETDSLRKQIQENGDEWKKEWETDL